MEEWLIISEFNILYIIRSVHNYVCFIGCYVLHLVDLLYCLIIYTILESILLV